MSTALITGASSGIGLALAKEFAKHQHNVVLVARNETRLLALQKELASLYPTIKTTIIVQDLALRDAAIELYNKVKQQNITIDYLVNNAGLGDFGAFNETAWDKDQQMIDVNITALTQLTKIFIKDMVTAKSGKILNVASTAAFQPGPFMSVYFASKAYVLHFSEAINNEAKPYGVSVTALCPGATQSDFFERAEMKNVRLAKGKQPTAEEVATYGYTQMMKAKPVAIHGMLNKIMVFSIRFVPRSFVVNLARKIIGK